MSAPLSDQLKSKDETRTASPDDLPANLRTVLTRIAVGEAVNSSDLVEAFRLSIELAAPIRDVIMGSLMSTAMARGPVADEVETMMRIALAVDELKPAEMIVGGETPVVIMAGSGKKGLRTPNVSTPAALVAAAAGARIVKVGSTATSSTLGSRDLVRALGLREHRTADGVRADLGACGFAFVAVEPEIPVLDALYGGRLYAPNPFSFGLALLASPVRGDITMFGLAHPRVDVAARVLSRFGFFRVHVVATRLSGGRYLDEIGSAGELLRCRVRNGQVGEVEIQAIQNETRGNCLPVPPSSQQEAVERVGELLMGQGTDSHRTLVCANAAYLLLISGLAASLSEGVALADHILRSGTALARLPATDFGDKSA